MYEALSYAYIYTSQVSVVARGTPGFSGADLANLVNIAAIKASQDNKDRVDMADLGARFTGCTSTKVQILTSKWHDRLRCEIYHWLD